jgi:hypothetical protein
MSDIIYYKNGEETFRISPPTLGTKYPETQLEIKMTEQKFTLELTLDELHMLDKYVEYCEETKEFFEKLKDAYPQPRMTSGEGGRFELVYYNNETYYRLDFLDGIFCWYKKKIDDGVILVKITDAETYRLLEGLWFNEVKHGKYDKPYCPDEPEHYDEVEWDEKDNPSYRITDEVVDRLIKQQQAQKLYNKLYDELGYDFEDIENVVGLVEDWLPKEQSAAGSQNVNTELLVDGFNHCLEKIKGMLR